MAQNQNRPKKGGFDLKQHGHTPMAAIHQTRFSVWCKPAQ